MSGEYLIPYDEGKSPGTWKYAGPGFKANVTCPDCQVTMNLFRHDIDETGVVSPSLMCPTTGCGFHKFVQLNGWQDIYTDPGTPDPVEVEFYIKSDAKEGGDGSKGAPLRTVEEVSSMLGDHETAKIILLDAVPKKKATRKKIKKKAKKKAAK